MTLRGLRLAWVTETREGKRLNEGLVKAVTGEKTITARGNYQDQVTFPAHYTLILSTNHTPHADADDAALWRRVVLIPFAVQFKENPQGRERKVDQDLLDKLRIEASGILAWLVRGALRWQADGRRLQKPEVIEKATQNYRNEEDTIQAFLNEECIQQSQAKVRASELYCTYERWANNNGLKPMSGTAFGKRITKRFPKKHSNQGTMYLNIGLAQRVKGVKG